MSISVRASCVGFPGPGLSIGSKDERKELVIRGSAHALYRGQCRSQNLRELRARLCNLNFDLNYELHVQIPCAFDMLARSRR